MMIILIDEVCILLILIQLLPSGDNLSNKEFCTCEIYRLLAHLVISCMFRYLNRIIEFITKIRPISI